MHRIPLVLAALLAVEVPSSIAQLRESTVQRQYSTECHVATSLPNGSVLKWRAVLDGEVEAHLILNLLEPAETRATVNIRLDDPVILIDACEVYGAPDQEIAAIRLRPRGSDHPSEGGVSEIVSFVQLDPRLEHLATISLSNQSGYGAARHPRDYFSWWAGDPLAISKLKIISYLGRLYANRVEIRRLTDSRDYFQIGAYPRVIGGTPCPAFPPEWMSPSLAGSVGDASSAYAPLLPVDTPPGFAAVILGAPEPCVPPTTLVLNLQRGQRRAHGLLFRDLSAARSTDRQESDHRIRRYLAALQDPPSATTAETTDPPPFEWSSVASARLGTPKLNVAVSTETTVIGTLERECSETSHNATPARDVWMIRIDFGPEDPAWIQSQLVTSCYLFPIVGGVDARFLYRTFDNGYIEPVVQDGLTIGLRAVLKPFSPVLSDGVPRMVDWAEVPADSKWGYLPRIELEAFDKERAEVVYSR